VAIDEPGGELREYPANVVARLRADDRALAETVFPGSKNVRPLAGLVC